MTRKVLLCDAAFSAMPLLTALKARGLHVAVCGGRAGDPGHALADASFPIDYSDTAALLALTRSQGFDYLVPGCTDVSYLACASVARSLRLPGFDSAEATHLIHHKGAFRQHADSCAYPVPRAVTTLSQAAQLELPLLVKPVDSFSGKGIVKVDLAEQLPAAAEQARRHSPSGEIVFEQFVSGQLYSHSAFLYQGEILADFFVAEYCTVFPYQVNSSCIATDLAPQARQSMRTWLQTFARAARLCDGLVHTQFIAADQRVWLIEVARRCPGDLYSLLIRQSTGVDYAALYVAGFCDGYAHAKAPLARQIPVSRHTVSTAEDGIFVAAKLALPAVSVGYVPLKKTGELMRAAPFDRAGIYFIEHADMATMAAVTEQLASRVKVTTWAAADASAVPTPSPTAPPGPTPDAVIAPGAFS